MIPMSDILAWKEGAPWSELSQVEQDLIISRAMVELFCDPILKDELRVRGGTALNKLHFPAPFRYSEDIDLTRTHTGPSKPIWDRIHAVLDSWLGPPKYFRSRTAPALRYQVPAEDGQGELRLKIEVSEEETQIIDPPRQVPLEVRSLWFSGHVQVPTFSTEEILATKVRALLQREQGRDLIDLAHAIKVFPDLDVLRTVEIFNEYVKDRPISRAQAEQRMFAKLDGRNFLQDVPAVLASHEAAGFDRAAAIRAFCAVFETFIAQIPGASWKSTPDRIAHHGLTLNLHSDRRIR